MLVQILRAICDFDMSTYVHTRTIEKCWKMTLGVSLASVPVLTIGIYDTRNILSRSGLVRDITVVVTPPPLIRVARCNTVIFRTKPCKPDRGNVIFNLPLGTELVS